MNAGPERHRAAVQLARERELACMFHEGGSVSHEFAKRINLIGRFLGIVTLEQFVPIHFQEKCAVTA
jgi:hypothetical protein